tara:strand:- start:393 stop:623 length:231 start_codon:yes stop_codon:yes gene_type:complete
MADFKIDARFLLCPLPVLKAQKKLKSMNAGDTLTVIGTSDDGIKEFEIFCSDKNIEIISSRKTQDTWHVILRITHP